MNGDVVEDAREFADWLTCTVLTAIRQHALQAERRVEGLLEWLVCV